MIASSGTERSKREMRERRVSFTSRNMPQVGASWKDTQIMKGEQITFSKPQQQVPLTSWAQIRLFMIFQRFSIGYPLALLVKIPQASPS